MKRNALVFALVLGMAMPAFAGRATTTRFVVARSRASMAAAPIGRIAAGEGVSVVRRQGAWALVKWGDGSGWIRTSALSGATHEDASPFVAKKAVKAPKSTASERKLARRDEEEEEEEDEEEARPTGKKQKLAAKLARAKAEFERLQRQAAEDSDDEEDEDEAPRSKKMKKGSVKVTDVGETEMAASAEEEGTRAKPGKGWGMKSASGGKKAKFARAEAEQEDDDQASADEGDREQEDFRDLDDEEAPVEKLAKRDKKAKRGKKVSREAAFVDDAAGEDEGDEGDDEDDEAPSARVRRRHRTGAGSAGKLMLGLGTDLGYEAINHRFVSDAPAAGNYLPRYSLSAGAATAGVRVRASYPVGPVRAGLLMHYQYGFSSGLTVPTPDGHETLAMATQTLEAMATAALPLMRRRITVAGGVGYARYGTRIQDGKQAVLPSEVVSGIVVGGGVDVPRLMFKVGLRAHLEPMPAASIAQNRGRREGTSSTTQGAAAGLSFYMPVAMKGRLKASLGYDYHYRFTDFSGQGERVNSTKAQRASADHALMLGAAWEM